MRDTGFLKNISDWVKGFNIGKPSVDANNSIEILYSRNFSEAYAQTITIDHLDSAGAVIKTDTLLDSKAGTKHDLVAKVYGDYRINVTNDSANEFYFTLFVLSEFEGYKQEFSLSQLVAGGTKSTSVLKHPSKISPKKPIYKVEIKNKFGLDDITGRRIYSLAVDFQGNVIAGVNGLQSPLLSKYNKEGSVEWTKDVLEPTIAVSTISSLGVDSNGNIYVGELNGSLYKIPSNGNDSEWRKPFGGDVKGVHVDANNNIYAVGGLFVRKYDVSGVLQWEYEFGAGSTGRSIDVGADGSVYVGVRDLGTTNKIIKFDQSSANDTTPPTITWSETITNLPTKIRVDGNNDIYYTDVNRLRKTEQDATGFTTEQLNLLVNITGQSFEFTIDSSYNIYINASGNGNNTVSKYKQDGTLIWELAKTAKFQQNPIIINDAQDVIYGNSGKIVKLKSDLQLTGYTNR